MGASQDVHSRDDQLNKMMLAGQFMEGYEQFYSEDVVMQENAMPPCVGKAANRTRQEEFFQSVRDFHSVRLIGGAIDGNRSYAEWEFEMTFQNGARYTMPEVAVRQWQDGQIVNERFYWDLSGYPGEL
jgi:ketosteroid isomerase-like protein